MQRGEEQFATALIEVKEREAGMLTRYGATSHELIVFESETCGGVLNVVKRLIQRRQIIFIS